MRKPESPCWDRVNNTDCSRRSECNRETCEEWIAFREAMDTYNELIRSNKNIVPSKALKYIQP